MLGATRELMALAITFKGIRSVAGHLGLAIAMVRSREAVIIPAIGKSSD